MKIVFDFAAQKITIEGDEPKLTDLLQEVRQIAPHLSHIQLVTRTESGSNPPKKQADFDIPQRDEGAPPGNGSNHMTLKQFVKKMHLRGASERIAAIAYYMRGYEKRDTFSPKDMEGWFTIAGLQKPKLMPVAVFDAKRHNGYVDNASHGQWKLTVQGENLVAGKLHDLESAE
jgi:hypothetical protein